MAFRESYKAMIQKTLRKASFQKALNDVVGRHLVKLCVSMLKNQIQANPGA